jgi:hypothetical protein
MNSEVFSEWLRRQGHQVISTASSCWYNAGPRVMQAFPYHWLIQPSEQELHGMMLKHGVVALRYSTPLEAPEGVVSYHTVLKLPYSIEMLKHQARGGIRKGLANSKIEQISFERLATEGWALQADTLERQCRVGSMSQDEWEKLCRAAEGLPGFEAWASVIGGELAAAVLTSRIEDTCYVLFAQSHRQYLNFHVNNALFYTVSCDMLARDGVTSIFFSLRSLDAPDSVDEFKFRMGFSAKPVRQRVVFHPLAQPLVTQRLHEVVSGWLEHKPSSRFLAKTEGMMHFYLDGKSPLNEQIWPECLEAQKENLLATSMGLEAQADVPLFFKTT